MTKDLGENTYRTYCHERLVVSESVDNADSSDKEEHEIKKVRKSTTLFIK